MQLNGDGGFEPVRAHGCGSAYVVDTLVQSSAVVEWSAYLLCCVIHSRLTYTTTIKCSNMHTKERRGALVCMNRGAEIPNRQTTLLIPTSRETILSNAQRLQKRRYDIEDS